MKNSTCTDDQAPMFLKQKESGYSFLDSYRGWEKVAGQERIWVHRETGWRVEYLFERAGNDDKVGVMYNVHDPEGSFCLGNLEDMKYHVKMFIESKLEALSV